MKAENCRVSPGEVSHLTKLSAKQSKVDELLENSEVQTNVSEAARAGQSQINNFETVVENNGELDASGNKTICLCC